jgi:hypothetical protein
MADWLSTSAAAAASASTRSSSPIRPAITAVLCSALADVLTDSLSSVIPKSDLSGALAVVSVLSAASTPAAAYVHLPLPADRSQWT